jgi:hypothetical protein
MSKSPDDGGKSETRLLVCESELVDGTDVAMRWQRLGQQESIVFRAINQSVVLWQCVEAGREVWSCESGEPR